MEVGGLVGICMGNFNLHWYVISSTIHHIQPQKYSNNCVNKARDHLY